MAAHTRTSSPTERPLEDGLQRVQRSADDIVERLRASGATAAEGLGQAAEALEARAPELAAASRSFMEDVGSELDGRPTQDLIVATAFLTGLWTGLAMARAPRWLLLLVLLPGLALAAVVASRAGMRVSAVTGAQRKVRR